MKSTTDEFSPVLNATEAFQRLLHATIGEVDAAARVPLHAEAARARAAEYIAYNVAECARFGFGDGALAAARELVRTGESAWLATAPKAAREAWAAVRVAVIVAVTMALTAGMVWVQYAIGE